MIIAIAGMSASGKNTLGKMLAHELKYKLICPTFKDLAKREGISLMEFQEKAKEDPEIDKKFDEELKKQAKEAGDCVATTWLSAWMLDADIKIAINTPAKVRAERLAKRDGMTQEQAEKHVNERDQQNIDRYMKVYGIDITDYSGFDLIIDNSDKNPEEVLELAMEVVKKKIQ